MSFRLTPGTRTSLLRIGKVVLGVAVGASFGVVVGALVASWIWGVDAIEGEAVSASYLAGGMTLVSAVIGGFFGFRSGRKETDSVTGRDRAVPRR